MCKIYFLFLLSVYGLAAGAARYRYRNGCVLPAYPAHGTYTVDDRPEAVPGQTYDFVSLTVTCDPGYGVVGNNATYCSSRNVWRQPMPQCIRFCRLTPHPSVKYYCKITGDGVVSGTRKCHELEPNGTVVVPECNRPVYYSSGVLLDMHCFDGVWDHVAICQPDCGTSTASGEQLIINGTRTKHGELPWHAGVYDKTYTPLMQVCGGSLVSTKVIISAAHCFWKDGEGRQPASRYGVALGKIYRPWTEPMDSGAHRSDINEIKIPERFLGEAAHYQADIALVFMTTPVVYVTYIRPVCIDFSEEFERYQLRSTNSGRVTGWGLTAAEGVESQVLLTAEMPYVDAGKCIAGLPDVFQPYVTTDKVCAGDKRGTTVCRGDSGGGLVFPSMERGTRRYFLRGVVSSAARTEHKCNANTYVTFTRILAHDTFIKDYILDAVTTRQGPVDTGRCVLPAYPPHGTYFVNNAPAAAPGQSYDSAILTVTCDPGYEVVGGNITYCFGGNNWQQPMAQCVRKNVDGFTAGAAQGGQRGCVLPAYPAHGTYTVHNWAGAVPGQTYDWAILTVTCDPGYGVIGKNYTYCNSRNTWLEPLPQCVRLCRLSPHPSVKYSCKVTGDGVLSGTRECRQLETHGTVVVPECNRPVYYSSEVLPNMHCVEGTWDYIAVCQPDCGTSTPRGMPLVYNGETTPRGELPWHAGIYDKSFTPYKQICGGSLISTKVLVSAAHCFWMEWQGQLPTSRFAVALGTIYRSWNIDSGAHKSDVKEIKIPNTYSGEVRYFQDDIALIFMSTMVVYSAYIRPVCVDFGAEFDREQLQSTTWGKVTGWGLTSADGPTSEVLRTAAMPYVVKEKCIADMRDDFKMYITSDKLCAGNQNDTSAGLCKGDSGGGLVFPSVERGTRRYYLRGVASSVPRTEHKCNVRTYTSFTHIQSHATFIKHHVSIF